MIGTKWKEFGRKHLPVDKIKREFWLVAFDDQSFLALVVVPSEPDPDDLVSVDLLFRFCVDVLPEPLDLLA